MKRKAKGLTAGQAEPPRLPRAGKGSTGYAPVAGEVGMVHLGEPYRQLASWRDMAGTRVLLTGFATEFRELRMAGVWYLDGACAFRSDSIGEYGKRAKLRGLPDADSETQGAILRLAQRVDATGSPADDHGVWASDGRSDVILGAHGQLWAFNARMFADLLNMTDAEALRVSENGELAFYRGDRVVAILMRRVFPKGIEEQIEGAADRALETHYAAMAVA